MQKRFVLMGGAALALAACSATSDEAKPSAASSALSGGVPIVGYAGKCLDASGGSSADGTKVQLWDCNGTAAQKWTVSGSTITGPGGKCLDAAGDFTGVDGTKLQLWDCWGGVNQSFRVEGTEIVGVGGKCLDVTGVSSKDGARIQLWDCYGGKNQQWTVTGSSGGGEGDGGSGSGSGSDGGSVASKDSGSPTGSSGGGHDGGGASTSDSGSGSSGGGRGGATVASNLPGNASAWTQTFADEFDESAVDGTRWNTTYKWGDRSLQSNGEQECYEDDSFQFGGGMAQIVAKRESVSCPKPAFQAAFTSGVLTSVDKWSQLYGYFELRAKLEGAQGYWPAFWLLKQDYSWPPEIDVFELIDDQMTTDYQTFHWTDSSGANQQDGTSTTITDASVSFHNYGVSWRQGLIIWYVDGVETKRVDQDVPDGPMYLLVNLAVGGYWPGAADSTTPDVGYMTLDHVRAFQCSDWSQCGQ